VPRITISYRRSDSQAVTRLIYERLVARFGKGEVFMDLDAIPPAVDYEKYIDEALRKTDLLLVVIGKRWLGARASGANRILDADDPVRLEVAAALSGNVPVLPILIERAAMPKESALPEDVRALAKLNAIDIESGKDFDAHVARLFAFIDQRFPGARPSVQKRSGTTWIVAGVLAAVALLVYLFAPVVLVDNLTPAVVGTQWFHDWVALDIPPIRDHVRLVAAWKLRLEYNRVVADAKARGLSAIAAGQFAYAQAIVEFLRSFGEDNGFALYFDGQIQQAIYQTRPAETNLQGNLYSSWFRYLENAGSPTAASIRASEAAGDHGQSAYCYAHVNGYCQQRTAWIRFVLANVFYCAGLEHSPALDNTARLSRFVKAKEYLDDSYKNYSSGFVQLATSSGLEQALNEALSPKYADDPAPLPRCPWNG